MIRKFIASLTAACFLFSFVIAPAVQATVDTASSARETSSLSAPREFLPSRLGMVTRLHDHGSASVVVNIQDLHCHAEVQRNIAGILQALVEGYRPDRVFIEGAAGDLDTSWLGGVRDAALKKEIADSLLLQGRLTGSEYYSVMNGRPRLLKGVEDARMHRANIVRLGRLLEKSEDRERAVARLKKDIDSLQARYFSSRSRRFSRLVELHRKGRLSSPKYYAALRKYAEEIQARPQDYGAALPRGMEDFPNIDGFLRLQELGRRLNHKAAVRQLSVFLQELKSRLPWQEYNGLLRKTGNLSDFDAVCGALAPYYRQPGHDAPGRFPQLAPLFAYVELKRRVNPLELVGEERRLVAAARSALARNGAEREISFLVDFFGCFEDYLFTRISAEEYGYVAGRYGEFEKVLGKYVKADYLAQLGPDMALLGEYYRVNDDRTGVFLRHLFPGGADRGSSPENAVSSPEALLGGAREIIVVVTGGFHTEGLEKLLEKKKISSIVITPSVREDTRAADALYRAIIAEQGREFAAAAPEEQAPAQRGRPAAPDAIQYAVESSRNVHLRALGLGLLGAGDSIDEAKAAQLGMTVTRDEDGRAVTLSDGRHSRRLALPQTVARKLRAAPARVLDRAKKAGATVLLKTGESTSLGYWLAKALFPYDTARQQAWGRRVVPFQTAALAAFFVLSPAAGIGALAGGFAVQQLLKRAAMKRAGERVSPWQYVTSAVRDMVAYGLFMAVPASVGISYAFLPMFVSNPLAFTVFSAFFVLSAVFNLHRLKALNWSAPALVATFALAGFVVPPVMGSIGAIAMPLVAWTQVAAAVYTLAMSAILVLRGGPQLAPVSRLRRAAARITASLLILLLMFPTQAASTSGFAPAAPRDASAVSSLWQGVPSLINPDDIVRVLLRDPGYYADALSSYIRQMDDLTILKFSDLYSDSAFGPLQRKIQDIMDALPRDPVLRAGAAENIRFTSDIQKRIFIEYGVLVTGAHKIDLLHTEKILAILPPEHYRETTLVYFSPLHDQVEYKGMNFHIVGKRFIVNMEEEGYSVGAHEFGHSNGPTAAFSSLNARSGKNLANYERQYGMKNVYEDWATIYEMWVKGSAELAARMGQSANFAAKVREVVKKFVIVKDGETYLRVYGKWNLGYTDVPFDGDVERADLAALAANAAVPDTLAARVLEKVSVYNSESAKALVAEEFRDATPAQLYDLLYSVYIVSGNDAAAIARLIAQEGLVALPGQMTFEYLEDNVHSWEDLVLLGNLAPEQVSAALLSDPGRLYRLIDTFPQIDGRFLLYMDDKDDFTFMPAFFDAVYKADQPLALRMLTRSPELITYVAIPPDMAAMAEDLLFNRVMDWENPHSLDDKNQVRLEVMALDHALRLEPGPRQAFFDRIEKLYNTKNEDSGSSFVGIAARLAELNDALKQGDYAGAGTRYDELLTVLEGGGISRWVAHSLISEPGLQAAILFRAKTDPAGALHMISQRQKVLLGDLPDLGFLLDDRALALAMLNADPEAGRKILTDSPLLGELIVRGSPEDAGFVVDVIKAVGHGTVTASMNAYYWSRTSGGNDSESAEAVSILTAYKDYAEYIPAADRELYQSVIDRVGGVKPRPRVGTMLANKAQAMQWVREGRSGLYIALRITLMETLPRMFAPGKFIAGHAKADQAAARSIVRAGRWGGLIAGTGSAVVTALLALWNIGMPSPLNWLLFVPLAGIAGWTAGRLIAGGVRQIGIDTAAYTRSGRTGALSGAKMSVPAGLLKTAGPTALGYWLAKALFPHDTERQQAWGRRTVPLETAALAAFFLISPAAGICALAGGLAVRQLLKLAAEKRSFKPLPAGRYFKSAVKDAFTYLLFAGLPASVGIAYAFYPLFVGNTVGFALFTAFAVWSAVHNLRRLNALRWSAPSLVAAFSLFGFAVFPVMGAIGALAMPVVAWAQVATAAYAAAMSAVLVVRGVAKNPASLHLRPAWSRLISSLLIVCLLFPAFGASAGRAEALKPASRVQQVQTAPSLWQGVPSLFNPSDLARVLANDPDYYAESLNSCIEQMDGLSLPLYMKFWQDRSFGPLQRKIQDTIKALPRDPAGRAAIAAKVRFSNETQKRIFIDHGVLLMGGSTVERAYMENLLGMLPEREVAATSLIVIEPMSAEKMADGMNYSFLGKSFVIMREGEFFVGGHEVGHSAGPTLPFLWFAALSGEEFKNYQNDYGMTNSMEDWATIYEAWVEDSSDLIASMDRSPVFEGKVREVARKFVVTRDGKTYLRVYKWNTYTDVPFSGDIADADLTALARRYVPRGYAMILSLVESYEHDAAFDLAVELLQTATPEEYYTLMYMVYSHSPNVAANISQGLAGKYLPSIPADLTFEFLEEHVHSWEDLALIGNMNPDRLGALLFSDQARANRLMAGFPRADGHFLRSVRGLSFLYSYFAALYAQDPDLARGQAAQYPDLIEAIPVPWSVSEDEMAFAEWFLFTQKMDWNDPYSQESFKDAQFLEMALDYAMHLSPAERDVFIGNLGRQHFPMAEDFGPLFADIVRARASIDDAIRSGDHAGAGKYFKGLLGLLEKCVKMNEREEGKKGHLRLSSDLVMNPMLVLESVPDAHLQAMVWGLAGTDPAAALELLALRQKVGFNIGIDLMFLLENRERALAMFEADPATARELLTDNRFVGKVIADGTPGDAEFVVALINAVGPDAAAASMEEHRYWLVIGKRSTSEGNRLGRECVEAYENFAQYLPDSMQETYRSMLEQVGAPKGTMTANRAAARRWAREGRSGWYIALRIALRETLPRMIAPEKKFVAAHAEKDKAAARSIVRAGRWGGLAAGISGVAASAGLLGNLLSSSPLSWLLFVTLSGIAGWTAGRLIVGGLRHVAIDAAAYAQPGRRAGAPAWVQHALRAPAVVFSHAGKIVSTVLLKTGESTSLGYWLAKALFPYDTERQQAWGRRAVPLETAALAAFFLLSPAAGICVLAGGFTARQLLKFAALKRGGEGLTRRQLIGSTVKEVITYGLFMALPAALGIGYAFVPLFMSNSISFAAFSAFVVISAAFNLHRLRALKWSSPSTVATVALTGFAVPPVMGAIGAAAMPLVAWTQVAAIVYTAAMAVLLVSRGGLKPALSPARLRLALSRVTACLLVVFFLFPASAASSGAFRPAHAADRAHTVQVAPLLQGVPSLLNPVDIVRVLNGDTGYYEDALSTYIEQLETVTVTQFDDLVKDGSFGPLQRKVQNILNALPRDPAARAAMAGAVRFSNDTQERIFIDHGILLVGANRVEQVYLENLFAMLPAREVGETTLVYVSPLPDENRADGINYHVLGKVFVALKEGRAEVGDHEIGHTAGPTGAFRQLNGMSGDDLGNYESLYGMKNTYEDWATIYAAWVEDTERLIGETARSAVFEQKVREVAKKFVITKDGQTWLRIYKWNTCTDVPFEGDIADADLAALARQYAPSGTGLIASRLDTHDYDSALALARQQLQAASPEDYYRTIYMVYAVSSNFATRLSRDLAGTGIAGVPADLTFEFLEAHVRSWEDLALIGNLYPDRLGPVLFSDPARANRLMAGFPRADALFLKIIEGMNPLYAYFESAYHADPAQAAGLAAQYPDLIKNMPLPRNIRGLDGAGMQFAEWLLFTQKMDWSDPYSQESLKNEDFLRMAVDYALRLTPSDRGIFLDNIARQHFPMARNFGPMFSGIVRARALVNDALAAGDYAAAGRHFDRLLSAVDECQKYGELVQEKKAEEDGVTFAADRVFNPMMIFETITDADLQAMVWARAGTDPAGAMRMLADRQRVIFNIGIDLEFLLQNKPLAIAMFEADPAAAREMFPKNRFAGRVIEKGSPEDAEFIVALINAVGPDAVAASMEEHRTWLVIGQRSTLQGRKLGEQCVAAYENFAQYLPDSMQETYRSMLEQVGAPRGTMLVNRDRAMRWLEEGRSGLFIAVRIALMETLPRVFAPEKKFVAGHAEEDKPAARSIVRAGRWGGIVAGIGGMLASAGLLWNLASSSPLGWLLFVTLSGVAGWTAGRLIVGGLQHVAIDAAVYKRLDLRALKADAPSLPVDESADDAMHRAYTRILSAS